jgi:hypothetical protein
MGPLGCGPSSERNLSAEHSCPVREEPMDANSGEAWSEMEIADLAYSMACDGTIEDAAIFLCRDEDEVRHKAKELRLVESPAPPRRLKPL